MELPDRAPPGGPSGVGDPPKWVPTMRSWALSVAPIASNISRATEGKVAWSPVYSMNRLGMVTSGAHATNPAFEDSPDQVDSHASAVVSRPKPVTPKLMRSGRRPWIDP